MALRITIDGPAGAGKSTVARELAAELGYSYLDTGAMYRALALMALRRDISPDDEERLARLLDGLDLRIDRGRLLLDGADVSDDLRAPAVDRVVARVARHPEVRLRLVRKQREIAATGGVVLDGRDTGSVVLPQAECKFFLTASLAARAQRRHRELLAKGVRVPEQTIRDEMQARDELDLRREVGALQVPSDALVLDTSGLTVAEVLHRMLDHCRTKGA